MRNQSKERGTISIGHLKEGKEALIVVASNSRLKTFKKVTKNHVQGTVMQNFTQLKTDGNSNAWLRPVKLVSVKTLGIDQAAVFPLLLSPTSNEHQFSRAKDFSEHFRQVRLMIEASEVAWEETEQTGEGWMGSATESPVRTGMFARRSIVTVAQLDPLLVHRRFLLHRLPFCQRLGQSVERRLNSLNTHAQCTRLIWLWWQNVLKLSLVEWGGASPLPYVLPTQKQLA